MKVDVVVGGNRRLALESSAFAGVFPSFIEHLSAMYNGPDYTTADTDVSIIDLLKSVYSLKPNNRC